MKMKAVLARLSVCSAPKPLPKQSDQRPSLPTLRCKTVTGQAGHSLADAPTLHWPPLQGSRTIKGKRSLSAVGCSGRSVLGTSAKISGANLFTRLNYWVVALGGSVMVTPPELNSVEAPSTATILCQGDTFTFKLDQAPADNGGIYLVIEASEGQSNGVSRAHSKAAAIKLVEEPTATAVDIRADYVAKNGAPSAAAPKIFFRYYLVDSSTGVKSQTMLAECKWVAGA